MTGDVLTHASQSGTKRHFGFIWAQSRAAVWASASQEELWGRPTTCWRYYISADLGNTLVAVGSEVWASLFRWLTPWPGPALKKMQGFMDFIWFVNLIKTVFFCLFRTFGALSEDSTELKWEKLSSRCSSASTFWYVYIFLYISGTQNFKAQCDVKEGVIKASAPGRDVMSWETSCGDQTVLVAGCKHVYFSCKSGL